MKSPEIVNQQLESFLNQAEGGTPEKIEKTKAPTKTDRTSLNLTDRQRQVYNEIKAFTRESSIDTLFYAALKFAQKKPFDYMFYADYLDLLTDKSSKTARIPYTKKLVYEPYKAIANKIKSEWLNIPLKGVILMYLLHYAKNKYNMDIRKFLN